MVAVVEDGGRVGGVASAVRQALSDADVDATVVGFGLSQEFFDHMSRAEVLARSGLTPQDVARRVVEVATRVGALGAPGGDPASATSEVALPARTSRVGEHVDPQDVP